MKRTLLLLPAIACLSLSVFAQVPVDKTVSLQSVETVSYTHLRNMKMRSETSAACHEIDRLVRDQVRFDGGDTVAYDPFHLVEGADQVDKRFPGALPEVADVDACQHDLFSPV